MTPEEFQEVARAVVAGVPQQPQRQDSTNAQLADLRPFAIRLGVPVPAFMKDDPTHELSPRMAELLRAAPALAPKNDLSAERATLLLRSLANRLGLYDAADVLRGATNWKN